MAEKPLIVSGNRGNLTRKNFERIYTAYNKREFVSPDPLQFLYDYPRRADREIAALIASSLAYGRVASILQSVEAVLAVLGPNLSQSLQEMSKKQIMKALKGFVHRFTNDEELGLFLLGIQETVKEYHSLEECFIHKYKEGEYLSSLEFFCNSIKRAYNGRKSTLVPSPMAGSACKRLHLFLRWMVREDEVDPGGWTSVKSSSLIVPLDTHMYNFALCYGITTRKSQDYKTAAKITDFFRRINPNDPVKYDFALTRFGIRHDLCAEDLAAFMKSFK